MEIEVWRDIPEYEGLYQVSNFGNVKSLHFGKEKLLKLQKNNKGYLYVNLYNNKYSKRFLIHRLVAKCFLEAIEGKDIVNHKDQNPLNNNVDNLEFCTYQYNATYNNAHIKRGEKTKGRPNYKRRKSVLQYSLEGEFIKEWESGKIAGETLNINNTNITQCCKGNRKSSGDFIWKYKKPY